MKAMSETVVVPTLREANQLRQREWDVGNQITLAYRGNELAGEAGEACNVIKKIERERLGIRGSRATVADLADELADVVICADLIAMHEGIDLLNDAVPRKFNATSEKVGLATRLAAASPAPVDRSAVGDDDAADAESNAYRLARENGELRDNLRVALRDGDDLRAQLTAERKKVEELASALAEVESENAIQMTLEAEQRGREAAYKAVIDWHNAFVDLHLRLAAEARGTRDDLAKEHTLLARITQQNADAIDRLAHKDGK